MKGYNFNLSAFRSNMLQPSNQGLLSPNAQRVDTRMGVYTQELFSTILWCITNQPLRVVVFTIRESHSVRSLGVS